MNLCLPRSNYPSIASTVNLSSESITVSLSYSGCSTFVTLLLWEERLTRFLGLICRNLEALFPPRLPAWHITPSTFSSFYPFWADFYIIQDSTLFDYPSQLFSVQFWLFYLHVVWVYSSNSYLRFSIWQLSVHLNQRYFHSIYFWRSCHWIFSWQKRSSKVQNMTFWPVHRNSCQIRTQNTSFCRF